MKWVDTNKGDDQSPNYRSRLVAREVRQHWEQAIFAPTPPLEALRTILSIAATDFKDCLVFQPGREFSLLCINEASLLVTNSI